MTEFILREKYTDETIRDSFKLVRHCQEKHVVTIIHLYIEIRLIIFCIESNYL